MDERELRLRCVELAGGDVDRARLILDFVMLAKPIIPPVKPFTQTAGSHPGFNGA